MQFFHHKVEVNHPVTLAVLLKNTELADAKITPLYVREFNDVFEQIDAAQDPDLFGIILHKEMDDGHIDGEAYMITIASKRTLNLLRPQANEAPLSTATAVEAMNKLADADLPLVNCIFCFEINSTDKVLAIENLFVNEAYRNKGLMKKITFNFIQAIYNFKGDFVVVSQPIHIATLKFFATHDFESQQLAAYKTQFKADGHIIGGQDYGVLPLKPALILLRHHAQQCAPEDAAPLAVTTSELTQKFEKILADSIAEANAKSIQAFNKISH